MKRLLLLLVLVALLVVPVMAVDNTINVTMTNTRLFHMVDYGLGVDATLSSYKMTSIVDLANVQDWILYGSTDGVGWTSLDRRNDTAFTGGVLQTFAVGTPSAFRYYNFYWAEGFYQIGENMTIVLTSTNTSTPAGNITLSTINAQSILDISNNQYVPVPVYVLLVLLAFGFLIISNLLSREQNAALYAILSPVFFALSAWFSVQLNYITTGIEPIVNNNTITEINVVTANVVYHPEWLAYLMIVMFLIAVINAFYIFTKKPIETQTFEQSQNFGEDTKETDVPDLPDTSEE